MMRFSIRPARLADSDTVAALWHESWHDAHAALLPTAILQHRTAANFRKRIEPLIGDTLVATPIASAQTGTIGGFVTVIKNEIDQLFVARDWRGTGLASALVAAAEALLKDRGVNEAKIECAAGNARALRFYDKQGYQDTGVFDRPLWVPPGTPAFLYRAHIFVKQLG